MLIFMLLDSKIMNIVAKSCDFSRFSHYFVLSNLKIDPVFACFVTSSRLCHTFRHGIIA